MSLQALLGGDLFRGDKEEQTQQQRIVELAEAVRFLREEVSKLRAWPEEMADVKDRHSLESWRGRALLAEKKLALAYGRMRELDAEIVELKIKLDE